MVKRIIKVVENSPVPKYRQIIDSVYSAIETRKVVKGDKIPSINQICEVYGLSRDTVMFAFNELKSRGILISHSGKGYYINSSDTNLEERVFVLFDELNGFKEDLYNGLVNTLKDKANVEVFFHHFNFKVYKNLITDSIGNYTSYVIMPAAFDNTSHLLNKIPKEKVYILDRLKSDLKTYPVVYQNFELDFYDALAEGVPLLKKYRKLVFINPGGKEPTERTIGFEKFCHEYNFNYSIEKSLEGARPGMFEAYFLISDRDLVEMVKKTEKYGYTLGYDFGIVSFNDTALKEVVAGGITTISTNFFEMGKTLANMLISKTYGQIRNPSKLILRKSL